MFSFNTPPHPHTAREDDLSFLRLIRSRRVGPATFHRLVSEYGSINAALNALPEVAYKAGVEKYEVCPESVAAAELKAGRKANAQLIRCDSPAYPHLLRDIPDAPPAIWAKGNINALQGPMIAIVGARNASSLGLRMARGLANALSEMGIVIVAGLARGIDSAAHEASLKGGTIAIMAGGIDVIYPTENKLLAANICNSGCLITEQPPKTTPTARHFPSRNRIISGLCHGIIVVEAAIKSGSLITAQNALDQGREVMSVPGHPIDGRAGGCNQLLRDGAVLVRNAEDVIEALPTLRSALADRNNQPENLDQRAIVANRDSNSLRPGVSAKCGSASRPHAAQTIAQKKKHTPYNNSSSHLHSLESHILAHLSASPIDENSLIRDLSMPASVLLPKLVQLELAGKLTRLPGGKISLP